MNKPASRRKWPGVLSNLAALLSVLLLALLTGALWLLDPQSLQSLRLAQFDQFQRWQPRLYVDAPVRVIDIDEASLKAYGQWPWPRTRVAELVQRLNAAGAAAIAFDVLLTEPDRTSPHSMAQLWHDPQVSALLQRLPDHDQLLAGVLTGRAVVLGSSFSNSAAAATPATDSASAPYRIVSTGAADPARWLHGFDTALRPLPLLAAQAAGLGALNFAGDGDGVVRRVPLLLRFDDQMVPSLSAEALRVAQGARNYLLRSDAAGVQELRIGQLTVPTNAQAELWLHHTAEQPSRTISAARLFDGQLEPGQLQGQIVLVGSSAAGLMDLRLSPLGQRIPGVQSHALALEQMLLGQYLQRPAWAAGAEALVLVSGVVLIGLVALAAPAWLSALTVTALLGALFGGAWYAYAQQQLLLDAVNPAWAVLLSFGLASGVHHFVSEREQRWVRQAFSRYVSPNRVAHLVEHPEQLQLGGQRQLCSFVFTDLAGFTTLMESGDPARVVALLNEYLDAMLGIVFRHEGTLDRIVGDAVAVLFSAPIVQPDHRQRALDCALEMDAFSRVFTQRQRDAGVAWGHTRIGVHCGEVIVGNFGGKTLFDYRALGDPINTAARLESVNKHLGTRVCVSQAIIEGCPAVPVRAVGRLVLKGKSQPLQVLEPLACTDPTVCAPAAEYAAAMALLQPGSAHSEQTLRAHWQALAQRFSGDPLVQLHARRVHAGATDELIVMAEK